VDPDLLQRAEMENIGTRNLATTGLERRYLWRETSEMD
jgi:hypothetical protein